MHPRTPLRPIFPNQLGGKSGINDLINTLSALMSNTSAATTSNPARSGLVAMPNPAGIVGSTNESTTDGEPQKTDVVVAVGAAAALPEAAVGFE